MSDDAKEKSLPHKNAVHGVVVYRQNIDPITMETKTKEEKFFAFMSQSDYTFETQGHCRIKVVNNQKGCLEITVCPVKEFFTRVKPAYSELINLLFGEEVPENIADEYVTRNRYKKVLKEVESKYNIEEGDPDFGEWTMTLIMCSPRFYTFNKGSEEE